MSYRTYRSVRYRYWCRTEVTEVHGTSIDVVPNLPKCPVPVLMSYRSYLSVRYRYWCRTELNEVSGTSIDVPNLPRCPAPVLPAVWLGTYRTEHTFLCMLFKRYPLGYQLAKKVKNKNAESPWTWKQTNNLHLLGWFLLLRESDSELHILVRSQKQISFVFRQIETGFLCKIGRGDGCLLYTSDAADE